MLESPHLDYFVIIFNFIGNITHFYFFYFRLKLIYCYFVSVHVERKKDLDILSVDIKMISNEETETGGVQVGAGTNDTVGGETGEFPSDVGENIHGVGNDEEDTIRGITNQRGNDLLKQGYVPLQQVQPGLALDLSCTRGDDAEVRPHRDGVVGGGVDLGSGEECCGVLKVQHLSSELVGNGVDED